MNKMTRYTDRRLRGLTVLLPLLSLFLLSLGGCSLLRRGDLHRAAETSSAITTIGFRVDDNALVNSTLDEDVLHEVNGDSSHISITVPYSVDTTIPLQIYWETLGDDPGIIVSEFTGGDEYNPSSTDYDPAWNKQFDFNDFNSPVSLKLLVYSPEDIGTEETIEVITVEVTKEFYPVLLNNGPLDHAGKVNPMVLRIGFKDEAGDVIDNTYPADPSLGWWSNVDLLHYNENMVSFIDPDLSVPETPSYEIAPDDAGSYNSAYDGTLPVGWELVVNVFTPDEQTLFFEERIFYDEHGYPCSGSRDRNTDDGYTAWGHPVRFTYDPPPVYLSNRSGNDSNDGLSPDQAVETWARAYDVLNNDAPTITELYIEGSDDPYNTDGFDILNTGTRPTGFNIHGGFRPGFDDRYDADSEDAHSTTILTDSNQDTGGDYLNPDGVLTYQGIVDVILDRVAVRSTTTNTAASALVIRDDSQITVNDCILIATEEDAASPTALSLINNSPGTWRSAIARTVILGRPEGSASETIAVYADNSDFFLDKVTVYSGETSAPGGSVGIFTSNSDIDISSSRIEAGRGYSVSRDSEIDDVIDEQVCGLQLAASTFNLTNSLIRSGDGDTVAKAVAASNLPGDSLIVGSTLATGGAGTTYGLEIDNGNDNLVGVYNSVFLTNTGNVRADIARGMFSSTAILQIMNNAIFTRKGNDEAETAGLYIFSGDAPNITNNLIWTRDLPDFPGIQTPAVPVTPDFGHNNIWSENGNAGMDLGGGFQPLKDVQASIAGVDGNLSLPVSVITAQDAESYFEDNHLNLGRVQSPIPDDIRFGGESLTGYPYYPFDSGSGDKRDRQWNSRTSDQNLGWSIGPYEYDDTSTPAIIYVSDISTADDMHPLGTMEAPFASLGRAYDAARGTLTDGSDNRPVTEIRVKAGTYDVEDWGVPLVFYEDIEITGGWNDDFSDNNTRSTLFREDLIVAGPVVTINGSGTNGVSDGFFFNGFNLESRNTNTSCLLVTTGAWPTVAGNVFLAAHSAAIGTWTGVSYDDAGGYFGYNRISGGSFAVQTTGMDLSDAWPEIDSNDINSGTGNAGKNTGIQMSLSSNPTIHHNSIVAGSPNSGDSIGIYVGDTGNPWIYDNTTITSGSPVNGMSVALQIYSSFSPTVERNTITAGSPTFGESRGVEIANSSSAFIWDNTITAGSPGSGDTNALVLGTSGSPSISGNTINGGDVSAGNVTRAIQIYGTGTPWIHDNIRISAGDGETNECITINNGSPTIENNTDIRLGSSTADVYGLYVTIDGTTIKNNTITGGVAGGNLYGMEIIGDSTVEYNTVSGGSAGGNLYGISINGAAGSCMYNNIQPGTGDNTYGIYALGAELDIVGGTIDGGTGATSSTGIYINGGTVTNVTDITLSGGDSPTTTGIFWQSPTTGATFERNMVTGGDADDASTGVDIQFPPDEFSIRNNFIHGGKASGTESKGLFLMNPTDLTRVYNNTVYGGNNAGGMSTAIHSEGGTAHFINNFIIAGNEADPANAWGFRQDNFGAPTRFMNNLILEFDPAAMAYWAFDSGDSPDEGTINGLTGGHDFNLVAEGEQVDEYLMSFSGAAVSTDLFPGGDWHLTGSGGLDATGGGMDLSAEDAAFDFSEDIDFDTRAAWSIGADEL